MSETKPIRHPDQSDSDPLIETPIEGINTVNGAFLHACQSNKDNVLMMYRDVVKHHIDKCLKTGAEIITYENGPVKTIKYGEVEELVKSLAAGLKTFDKSLTKGSKMGVYLATSKEWTLTSHACYQIGVTVVTCYANLGLEALIHIVNEAELTCMLCSAAQLKFMDENVFPKCPTLKRLVVAGTTKYVSKNYEVSTVFDLILAGRKAPLTEFAKNDTNDLALVMYTSGTTGTPKGVMITHKNIISDVAAIKEVLGITPDDVHLAYLPSAHIFEFVLQLSYVLLGAKIGFASPRTLMAKTGGSYKIGDLQAFKPTILVGVPRVYETIKKGVMAKIGAASTLKQFLFTTVLNRKISWLKSGSNSEIMLENTVFKLPRALFGGKIRIIVSGGAPLSSECQLFIQAVLGTTGAIVQGYGLTETTAAAFCQDPYDWSACGVGNVGRPVKCNECKLVDVPELGYLTSDNPPRGEICMRGPNITRGYYKNEKLTNEVYDKDGWFHSGDIGRLNEDGTWSIIDRKKNLVKLPGGEYVALENLEMIYGTSDYLMPNGCCVFADSHTDFIIAVGLADQNAAMKWAKENEVSYTSLKEVLRNDSYKEEVLKSLADIGDRYGKKKFEMIKQITIYTDMWLPSNGLTTAAMKLKRRAIGKKYEKDIRRMFSGNSKEEEEAKRVEKKLGYPAFFSHFNPILK